MRLKVASNPSGISVHLKKGLDGAAFRNFTPEIGAHECRIGNDTDSAQVESIGVPAGRDGRIVMMFAVGVPDTCVMKKLESVVIEEVGVTAKTRGKFRTSGAVAIIPTVVLAATVVEDSEQTDNNDVGLCACGKQEAIALDASPVARAMYGIVLCVELTCDKLPKLDKINVHLRELNPKTHGTQNSLFKKISAPTWSFVIHQMRPGFDVACLRVVAGHPACCNAPKGQSFGVLRVRGDDLS